MFTKPLNQYTFMGPCAGTCNACGVITGTNLILHTSDNKVIMCDFCIETHKLAIPDIHRAFEKSINKITTEHKKQLKIKKDEEKKDKEYIELKQQTRELVRQIESVLEGRPTNNIEYKLNQIVKSGGIVGSTFKVASNRVKKQKQMIQLITSLMKKHGGFKL